LTIGNKKLEFTDTSNYYGHQRITMEVVIMKTAAVSALKASLSEYLAGVKAGEEIIVTDRGKPIAKLVPLQPGETETPDELRNLERAGLVRIGTGKIPDFFWDEPRMKDKQSVARKALLQEREEGR
jgi:prevent-host-death family protein